MLRTFAALSFLLVAAMLGFSQGRGQHPPDLEEKLPGMKQKQIEDLLRADHAKSIEDAGQLIKLSEDLKIELEKNDRHVLSLAAIKKTEEIEKVAKRIRSRMRRF